MTQSLKDIRALLQPLQGTVVSPPPIWLMRQAGRYLPEYRDVRAKAGSFLDLCYSPALAAEVTLQPIRRFGFDAAILFSDILVVADALGLNVQFVDGDGPRLDPIRSAGDLTRLGTSAIGGKFGAVAETVARVRQDLPRETALIGFCGGPWTVATYMVAGQGTPDQAAARLWAYRDPEGLQQLIDLLVETSIDYLTRQVKAGADVVQIFDSWAGNLPDDQFRRWIIVPTQRICAALKAQFDGLPVIGFARGAGVASVDYADETGIDGVSCETVMPLAFMSATLAQRPIAVQGNLDPLLLQAGGTSLELRVRQIVDAMNGQRFIFNLGHGILPETPPENVARLVELVRQPGD